MMEEITVSVKKLTAYVRRYLITLVTEESQEHPQGIFVGASFEKRHQPIDENSVLALLEQACDEEEVFFPKDTVTNLFIVEIGSKITVSKINTEIFA